MVGYSFLGDSFIHSSMSVYPDAICPFGLLHTFHFLQPARFYPRFRIWRSSFERQRDLNPPEQRAAQHALLTRKALSSSTPCRFIPAHINRHFTRLITRNLQSYLFT